MKTIDIIYKSTLALLVGFGLQWFMYGMFTFKALDFDTYEIHNWVLQMVYFSYCVTLSFKIN
jgi:hypothetical protein